MNWQSIVKETISKMYRRLQLPYPPILDPDLETLTAGTICYIKP